MYFQAVKVVRQMGLVDEGILANCFLNIWWILYIHFYEEYGSYVLDKDPVSVLLKNEWCRLNGIKI
jgi:hypothetical protein